MTTAQATAVVTCTRCNGSGSFSFNLIHGTKCFGCMGRGKSVVNAIAHAKAQADKAARNAKSAALMARRMEIASQVAAELDAEFGPFANTEKGSWERVNACQRAYGCTPGDIVAKRLS